MRTVEKLLNSNKDMKLGNHRLEIQSDGEEWYYYHATPIVKVNRNFGRVVVDNGGWNTSSTNRAINSYLRRLNEVMNYDLIDLRR